MGCSSEADARSPTSGFWVSILPAGWARPSGARGPAGGSGGTLDQRDDMATLDSVFGRKSPLTRQGCPLPSSDGTNSLCGLGR